MLNNGKLFLIPVAIAADTSDNIVPPGVRKALANIRYFLAEDIRTARRYMASLKIHARVEDLSFSVLNKDTDVAELSTLFTPVFEGNHLGVMSESGCPGIADPGAAAVGYAHAKGIKVVPLVGPSAIFLALMASGLNGQHFAFRGYLPIHARDAEKVIRELEKESRSKNQTEIFIETPYRNNALFSNLIKTLAQETRLCVAVDVTGENEFILTQTIASWRSQPIELRKAPAVFLFLA